MISKHQQQQQQQQQKPQQPQMLPQQQQQQQQQKYQNQPQNSCSCCFDKFNRRSRMSMDHTIIPTQDSKRCASARASTMHSIGGNNVHIGHNSNYDTKPLTSINYDQTSDSIKKCNNDNHSNYQCGDGQQQDLNNKSVLSILEELKKRNSSDIKTSSSLIKTNIMQNNSNNNSDDYNCTYNSQNVSSDNTTDIGLKDILATIQKYYPIVDKNVLDNIRANNRLDMEIELDKEDEEEHRSYEEEE